MNTGKNIVAYLLKARTVEPMKQPLLSNGLGTRFKGVSVGSGVFCAVRTEAIRQGHGVITGESWDGS